MYTDVIRNAANEHEVYFLLTSYAEAALHDRPVSTLPEPIVRLPLQGAQDVRARFELLVRELDAASKRLDDTAIASIKQALHMYGTALGRLKALGKDSASCA